MENALEKIQSLGILPVINIPEEELAVPLANALTDGGIPAVEVTLRSDCSLSAISRIKNEFPEMSVGAGTVLSLEALKDALSAGADYIVSPGFDREIVEYCVLNGIPTVPGCSTPTEIQAAVKAGLSTVKFFPSELNGGLSAIKLVSGAFPNVKFIPTGGMNFDNIGEYLSCGKIAACGGSYMATSAQLKNREFDKITEQCRKAMGISLGFRLAHIGINHKNGEEAEKTAQLISGIFGLPVRKCSASCFAGEIAECMNSERFGEKGHIGISTKSVFRAMKYLENKGIAFDESSIKRDAAGNITCIYLREQIAGFALHIVKE